VITEEGEEDGSIGTYEAVKEGKEMRNIPKVPINEKELAHYSNEVLLEYKYGIYKDNALTYMIRLQNEKIFKYLL
jgi:hypothetical protein